MANATEHARRAILHVTPEAIAALLQLPQGAFIESIVNDDRLGVMKLRICGAGWPVPPGAIIPTAEPSVVMRREARPDDMVDVIDWKLP